MIIDSHCHIYDEKLQDVKEEIIKDLNENNQIAICSADNIKNSLKSIELANTCKNIFATVGVHPLECKTFDKTTLLQFNTLICDKKVVAIGEIGLDYYYDEESKDMQKKILKDQIIYASKNNLPIVFHVRDAMGDFLDIIEELSQKYNFCGVIHSFSGSVETAKVLLNMGFYFGINGIVTFKNANKIIDVVKFLPLEKILIETDSPYLTPVPFRGKPNRPEYVVYVAQKIADIKQVDVSEIIDATNKNAIRFFNLKI